MLISAEVPVSEQTMKGEPTKFHKILFTPDYKFTRTQYFYIHVTLWPRRSWTVLQAVQVPCMVPPIIPTWATLTTELLHLIIYVEKLYPYFSDTYEGCKKICTDLSRKVYPRHSFLSPLPQRSGIVQCILSFDQHI